MYWLWPFTSKSPINLLIRCNTNIFDIILRSQFRVNYCENRSEIGHRIRVSTMQPRERRHPSNKKSFMSYYLVLISLLVLRMVIVVGWNHFEKHINEIYTSADDLTLKDVALSFHTFFQTMKQVIFWGMWSSDVRIAVTPLWFEIPPIAWQILFCKHWMKTILQSNTMNWLATFNKFFSSPWVRISSVTLLQNNSRIWDVLCTEK